MLPRLFRRAGLRTDLFDATDLAVCRMYRGARQVWRGLAKNAHEGLAAPTALLPWTLVLGLGQVLPVPLLALLALGRWAQTGPAAASPPRARLRSARCSSPPSPSAASSLPRLDTARRFAEPRSSALLHPLGVTLLLAIQWHAFLRRLLGAPARWKGRHYPADPRSQAAARRSPEAVGPLPTDLRQAPQCIEKIAK